MTSRPGTRAGSPGNVTGQLPRARWWWPKSFFQPPTCALRQSPLCPVTNLRSTASPGDAGLRARLHNNPSTSRLAGTVDRQCLKDRIGDERVTRIAREQTHPWDPDERRMGLDQRQTAGRAPSVMVV